MVPATEVNIKLMKMNDDEFVTFTQEMKQSGAINVEFILEANEARVLFSHQSWLTACVHRTSINQVINLAHSACRFT